jgi:hypothetical protein
MSELNYNELKRLFRDLLNILNQYGKASIIYQKRIVQDTLYLIDCDMADEEKNTEIRRNYKNLYGSSRQGLTEFYIHDDDLERRIELNRPLDTIREKLWEIFK